METNRPFLITSEDKQNLPILIVDKNGRVGSALAKKLQGQFLVVLISGVDVEVTENIVHIPYRRRIPMIPDNTYSHIFLIYNGETEMLDMLPSFVKKANATNARLLFITSIFETSRKLFQHLSNHAYHHVTKVIYGELFDDSAVDKSTLNVFIQQARTLGKIEIPNDGLGKIYPILFDDVLTGIIGIAFGGESSNKVLLVFPIHGYSELSVGIMLQRIYPLLKIDFQKYKKRTLTMFWPEDSQPVVQNYDLAEKIHQVNISPRFVPEPPVKKRSRVSRRRSNKKKFFVSLFVAFTLIFILPIVSLFTLWGIGSGFLAWSVHSLESGNLLDAKQQVQLADDSLNYASQLNNDILLFDFIAKPQKDALQSQINTLQEAAGTEEDVIQIVTLMKSILAGDSTNPKNDFFQVVALTKKSLISVQKMKAEQTLPPAVLKKLTMFNTILPLLENTVDAFPQLLGFEGSRTYLLVFQNNMELRPGGGFIGSYGVLKMTNGRMQDFQAYDVYDADGKLAQSIQPPFGIQRYLGAAHWYLRDSNFDPDFIRNAGSAMQFYNLETGGHVDGVVAIDTDFVKAMISVFGPVVLPDYHETVTADNFYLLTQRHAENNFFPGSTQKKDFLRSLYTALLRKIDDGKAMPVRQMITTIGDLIKQKHVLLAFPNQASQTLFTVNGLSSSLWDGRETSDSTFLDYLGVIDANLGANKSNYYLHRSVEQDVNIANSGDVSTTIKVTYQNTSQKDSPFGGDYKNYVRFVLPEKAEIQTVKIDDQNVELFAAVTDPAIFTKLGFVPPAGLEVEKTDQQGKRLYGFLLMVPAGKTVSVAITYSLTKAIAVLSPAFTYDLQLFKQPGTEDDPYTLLLAYPIAYQPVQKPSGLSDVGSKLIYNGQIDQDREIHVEFSRK